MDFNVKSCVNSGIYNDLYEIASSDVYFNKFKSSTVLIAGAYGFLGYYLTLSLLLRNDLYSDNCKVIALVRDRKKAEQRFGKLLQRDDLTLCVQDVTEPIKAEHADYVIHAAGCASPERFKSDPSGTADANLLGTSNLLEFAKVSKSKSALIISSLKVYGVIYGNKGKINEDDSGYIDFASPSNSYAVSKRAAETLAAGYCEEFGMNVKIARPAYVYGAARKDDDRVWAQFFRNAADGEDILLKSDGSAKRSFIYITDAVTALFTVLLNGENAVPYNIAGDSSNITIRGFAEKLCEVFPEKGLKLRFLNPADEQEQKELSTPLNRLPDVLDSSRVLALGWKPMVGLEQGIRRAVSATKEL